MNRTHAAQPLSDRRWGRKANIVFGMFLPLVMAACGGGGTAEPPPVASPPDAGALAASKPGELMDFVRQKLQQRSTLPASPTGDAFFGGVVAVPTASAAGDMPAGAVAATAVERSGTTVQEQGVDEADLLKTDGSSIHTLLNSPLGVTGPYTARVQSYQRLTDGTLRRAGIVVLPYGKDGSIVPQGLYLASASSTIAALGQSQQMYVLDACGMAGCSGLTLLPEPVQRARDTVAIDLLSTADPTNPTLRDQVRIDGRLIGSRLIGSLLYVVSQHSPQLAVEALPASVPASNKAAMIADLKPGDVLPGLRINGGPVQPLVAETDCYVQPKNASLGIEITTVTVFDLRSPTVAPNSRCFVGGTEALYMSASSLYLATTRHAYTSQVIGLRFAPQSSTDIHKFALNGATVDYRGSGEVAGHLGWDWSKRSYRMSEWKGDLRVLTFTGETGWGITPAADVNTTPPSPATLSVLRERASDRSLQAVAKLPNAQRPAPLGKPGEQVYAVRMIGDRGYVVTFRQTDPLYVIDLSNPADPRTVGELLIPGFSDYLFPMGQGLLLGIGKEADETGRLLGVKVALFDVADPARPAQLSVKQYGDRGSQTALDFSSHGVNLFEATGTVRVALPMFLTSAKAASVRGLQRLEVNTTARTLLDKPIIATGAQDSSYRLGGDRSVQIGAHVYYLADDTLTSWTW